MEQVDLVKTSSWTAVALFTDLKEGDTEKKILLGLVLGIRGQLGRQLHASRTGQTLFDNRSFNSPRSQTGLLFVSLLLL